MPQKKNRFLDHECFLLFSEPFLAPKHPWTHHSRNSFSNSVRGNNKFSQSLATPYFQKTASCIGTQQVPRNSLTTSLEVLSSSAETPLSEILNTTQWVPTTPGTARCMALCWLHQRLHVVQIKQWHHTASPASYNFIIPIGIFHSTTLFLFFFLPPAKAGQFLPDHRNRSCRRLGPSRFIQPDSWETHQLHNPYVADSLFTNAFGELSINTFAIGSITEKWHEWDGHQRSAEICSYADTKLTAKDRLGSLVCFCLPQALSSLQCLPH